MLVLMSEPDTSVEDMDADYTPLGSQPSVGVCLHVSIEGAAAEVEPSQAQQQQATGSDKNVINLEKEPAAKARKVMATRSDMWGHFAQIKDSANVITHGKCNYCQRPIKADTGKHGASSLKKHFMACKRNPHRRDPTQALLQTTPGEAPGNHKWDPEAVRQAFTEMIIEDELPFAFGEKSGFRKFMAVACPRFNVPSRRTTTRDAIRCYFKEKAMLNKFFKDSCQMVSLTTDCWTSQQQDGYMTITASFIDENWLLHKKVINFFLIKGHKGDDIGKNLLKYMDEWGMDRVMTITIDNASANDGGIVYVRKQQNKTPGYTVAKGKYMHMRCAAHILNLIVQDGLKEVDLSIMRVRAAVRYIRAGGTRLEKFKEILEEEKVDSKTFLKNDVPTRWNSTYIMLKAANVYEKVFMRLADEDLTYKFALSEENDGFGCPEEIDWENSKKMEEFLGHFFDLTTRVSASLSVTCNSFFHEIAEVRLLIQSWLDSEDSLQVAMGHRMRDKFNKYWGLWHINNKDNTAELEKEVQIEKKGKKAKGKDKEKEKENPNLLIYIAAALDPRYKLSDYTSAVIEEIFGHDSGQLVWAAVNSCLNDLFEEYRKRYAPTEGTSEVAAEDQRVATAGRGTMLRDRIAKKLKMNNGATSNAKTELDKYLAEACEETEGKFDILELIEEFGGLHIGKGKGKNDKASTSKSAASMSISKP
ncbi:hypothetical protein ACQ4PT_020228 [Festuca glaucescens]